MHVLRTIRRCCGSTLVLAALALVLSGGAPARTSATTIVVTTTLDGADLAPGDGVCKGKLLVLQKPGAGSCTLRAAIQTANASPRGAYVIQLPEGTMKLTLVGKYEDKGATGDLDVSQADISLVGKGPGKTRIDGGGLDRVLDVPGFSFVTLQALKITGGAITGSADARATGGGVRVNGVLRLRNVLIDANEAYQGGGLYLEGAAGVDLSKVTISHNKAGFGGGVTVAGGKVDMTNVTIAENGAAGEGGGIKVWPNGKASLLHVTLAGNTDDPQHPSSAISNSGTLTMRSSIVSGDCQWEKGTYWPQANRNVVTYQGCSGDKAVAAAGLQPLTASGNVVPTMGLAPTSPAVDFAFTNVCPGVDARGVKRPQGKGCDAGAYELVK